MKITFYWENVAGSVGPNCYSSTANNDGVSPLACLLTDDGGQHYSSTIPWLNEGLNRINSILNKKTEFADWSRDAWAAVLTYNKAKIYSLHDDSYFELLEIDAFRRALLAWLDFVQSEPGRDVNRTIEI